MASEVTQRQEERGMGEGDKMVYTVTTKVTAESIQQEVSVDGEIIQRTAYDVAKLKEQGLIDALVALGWTPPPSARREG